MKSFRPLTVVALALALFFASFAPSLAFLDKTRFAAHLGVAYFCFHHWVLAPYSHGDFAGGAPHRTSSLVKGGAALLFAVHEVQVAKKIADKSSDPLLHSASLKLAALIGSFGTIGHKFQSGTFSPSDVTTLNGDAGAVSSAAAADGAPIHDVPVAIPGI